MKCYSFQPTRGKQENCFVLGLQELCDAYSLARREYYFDRSPRNFDAILGRDFLNKYVETMNWSCGQMILKCDMVLAQL